MGTKVGTLLALLGCVAAVTPTPYSGSPCRGTEARGKEPADPVAATKARVQEYHRQAIDVVLQLRKEYPKSADALHLLGKVSEQCGNTTKALECWEEGLRLAPDRGDFYDAMAAVALSKAEYQKAVELCRRGIEKSPETPGLHGHLGEALNGLLRPEEAAVAFEREVKLSPKSADVRFLLGQAYSVLKQYDKAKTCYEAAIKLEPGDPRYYYGMATACARLGVEDEAQRYSQEFERQNKLNMERQRSRRDASFDVARARQIFIVTSAQAAWIYQRNRNLDAAEDLLRKAAVADPKGGYGRAHLAAFFLTTGRTASAVIAYKELIALEPENAMHHLYLGMTYAQLRQFDAARSEAKRAVELAPDNERCREFYRQLGGGK
jgi:tetratricopeptide (TPR) repeat protein